MTEEQELAMRDAHGQFVARQQSLAQHRAQALPFLQAALYTSDDPSTHTCLRCVRASCSMPSATRLSVPCLTLAIIVAAVCKGTCITSRSTESARHPVAGLRRSVSGLPKLTCHGCRSWSSVVPARRRCKCCCRRPGSPRELFSCWCRRTLQACLGILSPFYSRISCQDMLEMSWSHVQGA